MFPPRLLGRTGLEVSPLGISASYGVPTAAVERAVDGGLNYLYWGSRRTGAFRDAIRHLAGRRDRLVLVLQSYAPTGGLITRSVERGLADLGTDHADVLLLGYWNRTPPPRIAEACDRLKARGLVRFVGVSSHDRPILADLAQGGLADVLHVRYNAAHRGAEQDLFPRLGMRPPGIVTFTATCWKRLLRVSPAAAQGRTPRAGDCYRFALSHPAVNVCVTGPSSMEHVEELLSALDRGPMDDAELAWMRQAGDVAYGRTRTRQA